MWLGQDMGTEQSSCMPCIKWHCLVTVSRLKATPQDFLQDLSKLLVVNMSFNSLQMFSNTRSLSSVAVLNLSFNKLTSLPDDLGLQLPGLQQLYLANNRLSHLPYSLHKVPLRDLFLSENAFTSVPQARHSNHAASYKLCHAVAQLQQSICCILADSLLEW